jgi:endonuclease YncB( thermonuclease family)
MVKFFAKRGVVGFAAVCLAGSACWAVAAQPKQLVGVVTHVTDGDTLWVLLAGGAEPVKVRFAGIDAPEICQAGGATSLAALKTKALRQTVRLDTSRYDDYGRMLARVQLGSDDLGAWMVQQGQAWSYRYRNSPGPYAAEERGARAAGRGVWAVPGAVEPRAFRKQHGSCH